MDVDTALIRSLTWLSKELQDFNPFVPPPEASSKIHIPSQKIWSETSLIIRVSDLCGIENPRINQLFDVLIKPIKDPNFMSRLVRDRGGFGVDVYPLALADALGHPFNEEKNLVLMMIEEGILWPNDLQGWARAESLFSRALLGAKVNMSEMNKATQLSNLVKLPKNIFYFTLNQAYRLTHSIFFHTGFLLPRLFNQDNPSIVLEPRLGNVLEWLIARFYLEGHNDLALELCLSSLLTQKKIGACHQYVIERAVETFLKNGYVPTYLPQHPNFEASISGPVGCSEVFLTNYHTVLIFIAYLSVLKRKENHQLEFTISQLQETAVVSTSPPKEIRIGTLLSSAAKYDLEEFCNTIDILNSKYNVFEKHPLLSQNIISWLELQRRPSGHYGFFDDKRESLEKRGYNFSEIQSEISKMVVDAMAKIKSR